MESVRRATPGDLSTVIALTADFVAEQVPQRGGALWAATDGLLLASHEALAAAIDDPTKLVLLGALDGVPVGVLVARVDALPDGAPLAVVVALYVEPEGREVGVGSALLDDAIAWAAGRGCRGIDATVLPGNRDGKNFFEMHGMVARAIRVHRAVGEG